MDDHPLVREWLTNLINQQPDMKVCAEAGDTPQALGVVAASTPDVAIVDISLKSRSGLELIKELKLRLPDLAVTRLTRVRPAMGDATPKDVFGPVSRSSSSARQSARQGHDESGSAPVTVDGGDGIAGN